MKKIKNKVRNSIELGLMMAILLSSIAYTRSPTLANEHQLPKVGTIEKSPSGAGCSYGFADRKSKASIFVNIAGEATLMNFDGRDTNLTLVSTRSAKKNAREIYKANHLKIEIDRRFIKKVDYSEYFNVKITISNGKQSKIIKANGWCGC